MGACLMPGLESDGYRTQAGCCLHDDCHDSEGFKPVANVVAYLRQPNGAGDDVAKDGQPHYGGGAEVGRWDVVEGKHGCEDKAGSSEDYEQDPDVRRFMEMGWNDGNMCCTCHCQSDHRKYPQRVLDWAAKQWVAVHAGAVICGFGFRCHGFADRDRGAPGLVHLKFPCPPTGFGDMSYSLPRAVRFVLAGKYFVELLAALR